MDDDDAVVRKAALRVAWSIAAITLLLVVWRCIKWNCLLCLERVTEFSFTEFSF